MPKKPLAIVTVRLDAIVGGGQAIATMEDGRKLFVWGGLPDETVEVQLTKKKSRLAEGIVTTVIEASDQRVEPYDPQSYLSTSPWQIMTFRAEQHYKAALIEEAFELHNIVLPDAIQVYTDNRPYNYRNKLEFSWWWDKETQLLDLAFFRRGSHSKVPVQGSSLAPDHLNAAALRIRDILRARQASGFSLKTLLIRTDQTGSIAAQLYVKDPEFAPLSDDELSTLGVGGFELIYSDPRSPASVITSRLQQRGNTTLTDHLLGVPFRYATEGFFQINLPVYEQALQAMRQWILPDTLVIDLYSGVGSIGLTIGGSQVTLIEINQHAVREMQANIRALGSPATAVLAPAEQALDYITSDATIIVDPPRAGLDQKVIQRLLEATPRRIIYLSCNPVTQARDVALLAERYGVRWHHGYNFFPRTPHIEHLVVLDLK